MLPVSAASYPYWLGVHLGAVAISLSLFVVRLVQDQRGVDWRARWPWLRWVPHANDTVLLCAGIGLCAVAGWRPWLHGWLALKLALLALYVVTGKQALSCERPPDQRRRFATLALASVGTMIYLALDKPF